MRENFLHYVWKFKRFNLIGLRSSKNEAIDVLSVGTHNHNSGPDFFNAKLRIGTQLWAGNVEIHVKSSDWYLHQHDSDPAYDSVILHVVYDNDTAVFRANDTEIPTLELKPLIDTKLIENYKNLLYKKPTWINCESDFNSIDAFVINHWLERLFVERLEQKSDQINTILKASNYNWEAVLFKMLAKSFGQKVNSDAFYSIANSIDFSVVRKISTQSEGLEALFFGQAGWLEDEKDDDYYKGLQNTYKFQKQKFQLSNSGVTACQFFRLRPLNFPTLRLSQLARLYHKELQLFSKVMAARKKSDFYELLQVTTSSFWETHYTFSKSSKPKLKSVSKAFIDLLIINTMLPLKYCYNKNKGDYDNDAIIELALDIDSEKNSIVERFHTLKYTSKSALHSQGLIQLKTEYCDNNKCLQCAVGNTLLGK